MNPESALLAVFLAIFAKHIALEQKIMVPKFFVKNSLFFFSICPEKKVSESTLTCSESRLSINVTTAI